MSSPFDPAREAPISRWEPGATTAVADCRVFRVEKCQFRHPRRSVSHDFYVIDSADWVNVVAVTGTGEIVLVNQYRFGVREFSWELPGGIIDPDDAADPVAAGRRELLEETGYGGGDARLLGTVWPNPAVQNNRCHLVLIENVVPVAPLAWDEHEELECLCLPVDAVLARARTGDIKHTLTLTALFLFEPHWPKVDKPPVSAAV